MAEKRKNIIIKLVDTFIVIFILAPLVVFYWRGTWAIIDIYVFPKKEEISAWTSFAVGIGLTMIFNLFQSNLTEYIKPDNRILFIVVSRLYTYTFAFCIVNHWRGVWNLYTYYTGHQYISSISSIVIGYILLSLMRSLRNAIAPPLVIIMDADKDYFFIPTRFRIQKSKTLLYLADTAFSVIIIGSLVVFIWRGFFLLLDLILFPDDRRWSFFGSTIIGWIVVIVANFLQHPAAALSQRLSKFPKIIFEQVFLFAANFGSINIWRGIWYMSDYYIWPENLERSVWFTHGLGAGLLILLLNGNSLLVRGVFLDGEFERGTGCLFPSQFLTKFSEVFQTEVTDKKQPESTQIYQVSFHSDKESFNSEKVANAVQSHTAVEESGH